MQYSAQWFIDNGCELAVKPLVPFEILYDAAKGDPCNGCRCKDRCPAWAKITEAQTEASSTPNNEVSNVETNAQIAARTGLTKRQVAKRLRAGKVL